MDLASGTANSCFMGNYLWVYQPSDYALVSAFDVGEDTSSSSWAYSGGSLYSVYSVTPGGSGWRLAGSTTSYFQVVLPVSAGAVSYKLAWQTSGWSHTTNGNVYVNGTLVQNYASVLTTSSIQEIIVPNTFKTDTLTIKFMDSSASNSNACFTTNFLWLYQY